MSKFEVGTLVNDYKFESKLGEGGLGQVWLSSKKGLKYAVKIVEDVGKLADAEKEFADITTFTNPFLVNCVESFKDASYPQKLFVVMEYCFEGSLEKYINKLIEGKRAELMFNVDFDRTMKIFAQTILGLYRIHGRGYFHRNIKAENVLLTENFDAKIGDFGLTGAMESRSEATTPGYMAQEIILGKPYTAKVDIFALGVLIYKLCTLEMPFDSMPDFLAGKYKPFPRGKFSEEFSKLIYSMISANPDVRPTADDILRNPMIREFAARTVFKEKKLIDFFHPSTSTAAAPLPPAASSLPPAASSSASAGADAGEEVDEFITEAGASHPDATAYTIGMFKHDFADVFDGRQPTPKQCNAFLRAQRTCHNKASGSGQEEKATAEEAERQTQAREETERQRKATAEKVERFNCPKCNIEINFVKEKKAFFEKNCKKCGKNLRYYDSYSKKDWKGDGYYYGGDKGWYTANKCAKCDNYYCQNCSRV